MKFLNWFRKEATQTSEKQNPAKAPNPSGYQLLDAFTTFEGLSSWAIRLTQEVEVLKGMLHEKGLWDEVRYRHAITSRMINDHNSTGANSLQYYSYYPYILSEPDFLKARFKASNEEILAFNDTVSEVSSYT